MDASKAWRELPAWARGVVRACLTVRQARHGGSIITAPRAYSEVRANERHRQAVKAYQLAVTILRAAARRRRTSGERGER